MRKNEWKNAVEISSHGPRDKNKKSKKFVFLVVEIRIFFGYKKLPKTLLNTLLPQFSPFLAPTFLGATHFQKSNALKAKYVKTIQKIYYYITSMTMNDHAPHLLVTRSL